LIPRDAQGKPLSQDRHEFENKLVALLKLIVGEMLKLRPDVAKKTIGSEQDVQAYVTEIKPEVLHACVCVKGLLVSTGPMGRYIICSFGR
jgi:hypothetical protein